MPRYRQHCKWISQCAFKSDCELPSHNRLQKLWYVCNGIHKLYYIHEHELIHLNDVCINYMWVFTKNVKINASFWTIKKSNIIQNHFLCFISILMHHIIPPNKHSGWHLKVLTFVKKCTILGKIAKLWGCWGDLKIQTKILKKNHM